MGIGSCWINRCDLMLETPFGRGILEDLGLSDYFGIGCCVLGYPVGESRPKAIKENRVLYYGK